MPVWFNEGVAEVLEVSKLGEQGELVLERNTEWDPHIVTARRAGGLPSLRELLLLTPERFYGEEAPRNYAAAWSLVDFLLRASGDPGQALARRLYASLREHRGVPALRPVSSGRPL